MTTGSQDRKDIWLALDPTGTAYQLGCGPRRISMSHRGGLVGRAIIGSQVLR